MLHITKTAYGKKALAVLKEKFLKNHIDCNKENKKWDDRNSGWNDKGLDKTGSNEEGSSWEGKRHQELCL